MGLSQREAFNDTMLVQDEAAYIGTLLFLASALPNATRQLTSTICGRRIAAKEVSDSFSCGIAISDSL